MECNELVIALQIKIKEVFRMLKVYRFTIFIIMLFGIQFAADAQQQVAVSDPISNVVDEIVNGRSFSRSNRQRSWW